MNTTRTINVFLLICIVFINFNFLNASALRRSCGAELSKRIARVCEDFGGYNSPRGPHHRVRRRVADECCKKVCSDTVISLYCYSSSEKVPRAVEETHLEPKELVPTDPEPQYYNDDSASPSEHIKEIDYRPIRIGTVAPEYTRIAMTPPLYRITYYKVVN